MMNPDEYQNFIDQIFHASPQAANSIDEMNSFTQKPEALQIILSSIESQKLRRENLLISLSYIPHLHLESPDDMMSLKSWFENFCFTETDNLFADDFLALITNIFYFLFQDQTEGFEFISKLIESEQPQHNLAIQITLRIIEKINAIPNPPESLSMAVVPFLDSESLPPLIDSSALLLQKLLLPKQYGLRRDLLYNFFEADEEGKILPKIFEYIYQLQTENPIISIHLFGIIDNILLLNPAIFPSPKIQSKYIRMIMDFFFTFLSKVEIIEKEIPIISSIFLSLKKASAVLIRDNKLNPIKQKSSEKPNAILYDELISQFSKFTQFILENVHYYQYLELILEFWNHHEQTVDYINTEVEKNEKNSVLEIIMQKFFTVDVFHHDDIVEEILTDQSSLLVQKLVDFAAFDIFNVAKRVTEFLLNEIGPDHINIVTLCIEFLSDSSNLERLSEVFDNILDAIFFVNTKIPPATSVILEVSLIHFLQQFVKKFDSISDEKYFAQIQEKYSAQLSELFIRFLIDVRSPNCSIEIIQLVLSLLQTIKECRTEKIILILMSDERIFTLLNEIQSSTSQDNQPKKMIITAFSLLFQFGFLLPTPDNITSLIDIITSRLESDINDSLAYLMISGAFLCNNCRFIDFYNLINEKFLHIMMNILRSYTKHLYPLKSKTESEEEDFEELSIETINPHVYTNILHLFHSITEKSLKEHLPFMSPFVVKLTLKTLSVLHHAFSFISNCKSDSVDFLKNLSLILLIMSNLLKNKSINFSIFQIYENPVYVSITEKIFDSFLKLSFEILLQFPKLMKRYLIFMKSLCEEDLETFLSLDDIYIEHHLHILISILNFDNKELSLDSAKILIQLMSSMDHYQRQMVEDKFDGAISEIIESALSFIFKRDILDDTINKLIYHSLLTFPKQRQSVFDRIFVTIEDQDIQNRLHEIYEKINQSFEGMDEKLGESNFIVSLRPFLHFVRSKQIQIPF